MSLQTKNCFHCSQPYPLSIYDQHIKECLQKKNLQRQGKPSSISDTNTWTCTICTQKNAIGSELCVMCHKGKRPIQSNSDLWQCSRCTSVNPSVAPTCKICFSPKVNSAVQSSSQQPFSKPQQPQQPQQPQKIFPPSQFQSIPQNFPPRPKAESLENKNIRGEGEGGGGEDFPDLPGLPPDDNIPRLPAPKLNNNINGINSRVNVNQPFSNQMNNKSPFQQQSSVGFGNNNGINKNSIKSIPSNEEDPFQEMNRSPDFLRNSNIKSQPRPNGSPSPIQSKNLDDIPDLPEDMSNNFGIKPQPSKPMNNSNNNYGYNKSPSFGYEVTEDDPETLALIQQLMNAEKCGLCSGQGVPLPCQHLVCYPCGKKHLLQGIVKQLWKKEALTCPIKGCKGVIPDWFVRECGLGPDYIKTIEEMQTTFLVTSNESMTQCPNETCKQYFFAEPGEESSDKQNERGLDGKAIGPVEKKHKARWRFRCASCQTIFCGNCKANPYHLGYTCEAWASYKQAKKCRFCEKEITPFNTAEPEWGTGPGLKEVCNELECLEKRKWSCDKILQCGHVCCGIRGEKDCLGCLNEACLPPDSTTGDEFCNICWVEPLKGAPSIKLSCNHIFHFMCVWNKIERKWPAARITFGFLSCPLCKAEIHHSALEEMSKKYFTLKSLIKDDAVERVKIEGLESDERLKNSDSPYYNNLEKFAMDRLAFYMCHKCQKPYFGGMKACEDAGREEEEKYNQEHLMCGACASGPNAKSCKLHGKKFITYKCKFCCTVATWYCWGSTHFCDSCHKRQEKGDYLNRKPIEELPKCPGEQQCPLGVDHPPNGTAEYSLGCVVCMRK